MPWSIYLAHFFGAVFFANALAHLVAGVSGQPFPTPFASPPFRGLSSPTVNVFWALVNVALAYVLLVRVGPFNIRSWPDAVVGFVGFGAMAFQVAGSLTRLRGKSAP